MGEKEMILNDKYSIEKEAHGFSLVEKTEVKETKDGKETGKIKEGSKKSYYGTVYQALQGFLIVTSQNSELYDLRYEIAKIMALLMEAKEDIKKEFCIEVKST